MSAFHRVSVDVAIAWVDGATHRLETEEVSLNQASGRVLGADICAAAPIPPTDCAAVDGLAIRAEDSLGAGTYNPLTVPSIAVAEGEALPVGTDAVVPLDQPESTDGGDVIMVEPAAPGDNVNRQGSVAAAGTLLMAAGARLVPFHIGLLIAADYALLPTVRRPHVRLAIAASARPGAGFDNNSPMLRAAIERDGGIILESAFDEAFAGTRADIILVIGGTGPGREDSSAAALAAAGTLDIHGVALVPGETTGFGRTAAGVPVLLLPAVPAGCLLSYELFAGRAIRRLGGRDPALPYRSRSLTTARKMVSALGMTEICPVRRRPDGGVEPIASFAEIGLMAAARADGFVIVPEASEGYAPGTSVTAYLYGEC